MGSSILDIGRSALSSAQIGLATTGHNIANVSTPGYTRQVVQQGAVAGQSTGFGFVGKGTSVIAVNRVYDEFLSSQVLSSQSSQSQLSTFHSEISRIDNILADQNAGVSPALQDFFQGVQSLSSSPNSAATRQSLLSSGEALAARFQGLSNQLEEAGQGLNGKIAGSVININSAATHIASLNDAIGRAQAGGNQTPNDLLDMRDQAVTELSKETKVSIVKQEGSYSVFIGNGQPLVVGNQTMTLAASRSATDPNRTEIGLKTQNGSVVKLDESSLPGGTLGGLLSFRKATLDPAQNELGRMAIALGTTFNAQHALGQTQNGTAGGAFFNVATPSVFASTSNTGTGNVAASIVDVSSTSASDYRLKVLSDSPASYQITRTSDGKITNAGAPVAPETGIKIDGLSLNVSGALKTSDEFLIRPFAKGASSFSVAIHDKAEIAVGSPITASAAPTNQGDANVSSVSVTSTAVIPAGVNLTYSGGALSNFPAGAPISVTSGSTTKTYPSGSSVPYSSGDSLSFGGVDVTFTPAQLASVPVRVEPPNATLTYSAASRTFTGFPVPLTVIVTANGASTSYTSGAPVPYAPGARISFGGVSVEIGGEPVDGDRFTVQPNVNGLGDNRNAVALGNLQSAGTMDHGSTTYQGAYASLVSNVGSKAHELSVTSSAASSLLQQSLAAQQSTSGVNLDEEATNLLRYQQAYQAAGKLIQSANAMFDVLLSLGR